MKIGSKLLIYAGTGLLALALMGCAARNYRNRPIDAPENISLDVVRASLLYSSDSKKACTTQYGTLFAFPKNQLEGFLLSLERDNKLTDVLLANGRSLEITVKEFYPNADSGQYAGHARIYIDEQVDGKVDRAFMAHLKEIDRIHGRAPDVALSSVIVPDSSVQRDFEIEAQEFLDALRACSSRPLEDKLLGSL